MPNLLKSRRFVTAVLAAVVTLLLYFIGKYLPAGLEDLQMVLNTIMPLALILIAAYTVDDITNTWARAQVDIEQVRLAAIQHQVRLEVMRQSQKG